MQEGNSGQTPQEDAVHVGTAAQMRMDGYSTRGAAEINLGDMVSVMARLAQILAEEVDYLDNMKIKDIEKLQVEKRKLTRSLVVMKRDMDRHPDARDHFSEEDIVSFQQISEIFDEVLQENHRKLLVAKEINYRVVQAISDVVQEEMTRPVYNRQGAKSHGRDGAPSVSLNEQI